MLPPYLMILHQRQLQNVIKSLQNSRLNPTFSNGKPCIFWTQDYGLQTCRLRLVNCIMSLDIRYLVLDHIMHPHKCQCHVNDLACVPTIPNPLTMTSDHCIVCFSSVIIFLHYINNNNRLYFLK